MGSHHVGGVHVLIGDGAVAFVTDSIEAGNVESTYANAGGESPFGLWGALGTLASRETIATGL
jgi:hypothetical protein